MKHRVKKSKFHFGRDANRMLLRKLAINFIKNNKIVTTDAKAKVLKPYIEKLVEKSKNKTEANKNVLLKKVNDKLIIQKLFKQIGPKFKNRIGGYVRIIKLGIRELDGAKMSRVEWVEDFNKEEKKLKGKSKKKKEIDKKNQKQESKKQ